MIEWDQTDRGRRESGMSLMVSDSCQLLQTGLLSQLRGGQYLDHIWTIHHIDLITVAAYSWTRRKRGIEGDPNQGVYIPGRDVVKEAKWFARKEGL